MGKKKIDKNATNVNMENTEVTKEIKKILVEGIDYTSDINALEEFDKLIIVDKKKSRIKSGADQFIGVNMRLNIEVKFKTKIGGKFQHDEYFVTYHEDGEVYFLIENWYDVIYKLTDNDNHKLAVN